MWSCSAICRWLVGPRLVDRKYMQQVRYSALILFQAIYIFLAVRRERHRVSPTIGGPAQSTRRCSQNLLNSTVSTHRARNRVRRTKDKIHKIISAVPLARIYREVYYSYRYLHCTKISPG